MDRINFLDKPYLAKPESWEYLSVKISLLTMTTTTITTTITEILF